MEEVSEYKGYTWSELYRRIKEVFEEKERFECPICGGNMVVVESQDFFKDDIRNNPPLPLRRRRYDEVGCRRCSYSIVLDPPLFREWYD